MSQVDIPLLIVGAALCLFGWMIYWLGLRALGLAVGGFLGAILAVGVTSLEGLAQWRHLAVLVAGGAGAFWGMFAIKRLNFFMFFLIGCVGGGAVALVSYEEVSKLGFLRDSKAMMPLVYFPIVTVVVGLLVALLNRYLIPIVTSLVGTILVVLSVDHPDAGLALAPVFLGSLAIQFGLIEAFVKKEKRAAPESAKGEGKA